MNDLLDLESWPLHRLDSEAGRRLVDRCRSEMDCNGMFTLAGFMRRPVIERILPGLLEKLATDSFTHSREHNIFFDDNFSDLPPGHDALARRETVNHTLCGDQVVDELRRIYLWPELAGFLAQVTGKAALYPMDDRLACVNVMGYYQGEGLNWHFDRSEFTTTLLLQAPFEGGDFQYRHALRSGEDPNYDGIARLLRGEDERVATLRLGAGDLNVFKGIDTAHRVTPPIGDRARVVTVFTYYETPGKRFSDEENLGFYGRTR